eukprot:jgi/Mesvir1/23073/Mv16070-RA.1
MGTVWALCGKYNKHGRVVRLVDPAQGHCTRKHVREWWGRFAPHEATIDDLNDVLLVTEDPNFERLAQRFMPKKVAIEHLGKECFVTEVDYEVWRGRDSAPGQQPPGLPRMHRLLRTGARFLLLMLVADIQPTLVGFDLAANGTWLEHYSEMVITANHAFTPRSTNVHNVVGELALVRQLIAEGYVRLLTPDPRFDEVYNDPPSVGKKRVTPHGKNARRDR